MARERLEKVLASDRSSGSSPPSARRQRLGSGGRDPQRKTRILLADGDKGNRELFWDRLSSLGDVVEAKDGAALEEALLSRGPFQLVVANAKLPEPSALQVLARIRRAGIRTPFIVVSSVHQNHLRVFVSDSEGTVLSSRMVDSNNLTVLLSDLIEASR